MRTTLESGAWIEHVPIQDIKGKHIRDYARAGKPEFNADAIDDDGRIDRRVIMQGFDFARAQEEKHDALWAIVISAWSYDFPVPVFDRGSGQTSGTEVLDEIPGGDVQQINAFLEKFAPKLADKPDPKGATTSASNGSSRAKAGSSHPG